MNDNELPIDDGWYADSGGYLWALDDGKWSFYGEPSQFQPFSPVKDFGPFTRMLPVAEVEGMLGEGTAVPVDTLPPDPIETGKQIVIATAIEIADLIEPFSGIGLANGATRADIAAWIRARYVTRNGDNTQ